MIDVIQSSEIILPNAKRNEGHLVKRIVLIILTVLVSFNLSLSSIEAEEKLNKDLMTTINKFIPQTQY